MTEQELELIITHRCKEILSDYHNNGLEQLKAYMDEYLAKKYKVFLDASLEHLERARRLINKEREKMYEDNAEQTKIVIQKYINERLKSIENKLVNHDVILKY